MLPLPSSSCIAATVGLSSLLALGIALERASLTSLAGAGFVLLSAAYAWTFPLARRARAERLEFAWWLAPRAGGPGAVLVPGAAIDVRCFLRHRGPRAIRLSHLAPVLPAGLVVSGGLEGGLLVRSASRTEFAFSLEARSVGRFVAQGVSARIHGPLGLFAMPLYFPHPLAVKVLPRAARRAVLSSPRAPVSTGSRAGRSRPRRRGGGTELRELRELVPGDPFKSIAWKTSARLGKLVVREVEDEVDVLRLVAVDVSPSMRGGPLGERKLDAALDAVASLSLASLRDGDRSSAVTFDRRIVGQVGPGEGKAHFLRTLDLLLSANEVVDDDLTDVDDATVGAYVGRYLRHQMGLDFRSSGGGDQTFPPELVKHVRSLVGDDLGSVRAADPDARLLRRYCQLGGLALPYRTHVGEVEKTAALLDALSLAHRPGAPPAEITVVTDGEDLRVGDELLRRITALRAHGHRVRFVFVGTGPVDEARESALGRALADVYRKTEARRLVSQRIALTQKGVPSSILVPGDAHAGARAPASEVAA